MKIMIGQSIWRGEDIEHSLSMRELIHYLDTSDIPYIDTARTNDALIARSRNHLAMDFLQSDCDVLWITDGDMVFDAPDILHICQEVCKDPNVSIIGGAYPRRTAGHEPALRLPEGEVVVFQWGLHNLVEVDYLATGCLAIHRRVFETMKEQMVLAHELPLSPSTDDYYPFFSTFLNEVREDWKEELSEDFAFAKRAKAAGFKSWLDTGIRLGHVSTYVLTLEDCDRPQRQDAATVAFQRTGDNVSMYRAKS